MADTNKKTYGVLSPLLRDGKRYAPDDAKANTVELTADEAEELEALGVIGALKAEAPAKAEGGKTKE